MRFSGRLIGILGIRMSKRRERLSSEWELRLSEGVQRGIADMVADRLVLHEVAMEELDAVIEDAVKRTDA